MSVSELESTMFRTLFILGLFCLLVSVTSAQPVGAYKPGYDFDLHSIRSLYGFSVLKERVSVDTSMGKGAQQVIQIRGSSSELVITIAVLQSPHFDSVEVLKSLSTSLSEFRFKDLFFDGSTIGLNIGDHVFVKKGSTVSDVFGAALFARENVFVYIKERGPFSSYRPPRVNLIPIAQEIDSQIQAEPSLSFQDLGSHQPIIQSFKVHQLVLHESEEAWISLQSRDPMGLPLTHRFQNQDGDVIQSGRPIRYVAGTKLGEQSLSVYAINPKLLYSNKTIQFDVVQ